MRNDDYFEWSCVGMREYDFPDIYCPNCNYILTYKEKSIIREETSKSRPESKDYIITCKYYCENCNEPVIMTGLGFSENQVVTYEDPDYNKDVILYTPLFFVPTILLFDIPLKCPQKVKAEIIKSFSLFWSDVDSCVNKLRIALELLMDSQKISKTVVLPDGTKGKQQLTLHKRIDLFKKKNQKIGELLEAVKWIGNKGSHADKKLIVNEVIDAYDILEHALNELFLPQRDVLYDLARDINKRKGSLTRHKRI